MLVKENRLSNLRSKTGDFFKNEYFDLKINKSSNDKPKFAFVISKKVSKSAVVRNKTKRILAEAIRVNLDKIQEGVQVVIIAKKFLTQEDKERVEKIILEEFKKAEILK